MNELSQSKIYAVCTDILYLVVFRSVSMICKAQFAIVYVTTIIGTKDIIVEITRRGS